jgi:DNA-binding NarL/FixJ family response regulator
MRKILIADDNELLRGALKTSLSGQGGWTICGEAADGIAAVRMAEELKPDLIVLDFLMPGLNGLQAAAKIGKASPEIPIVLYTMHMSGQLEREAHKVGVRKVISKAEPFQAFISALQEFLDHVVDPPIGPLGITAEELKLHRSADDIAQAIDAPAKTEDQKPS